MKKTKVKVRESTVAIGNHEGHVRKASHRGSKQNRSHTTRSLYYWLFAPHTYIFVLRAHPVRGESHNQRNTTGEVATVRRLQQQTQAMPINLLSPKRKSNAWY